MRVYLYGIGKGAESAYEIIKKNKKIKVLGFLDSDIQKCGTVFLDKNVFHLKNKLEEFDLIIICSQFSDIYINLLKSNIDKEKIICFYEKVYFDIYKSENNKKTHLKQLLGLKDDEYILTRKMLFEKGQELDCEFEEYYDYQRYKTLNLLSREIKENNINGEVAEVGVYRGDFAKFINSFFSNKKLYLFDTFEGFALEDEKYDVNNGFMSEQFTQICDFKNTNTNLVLDKMSNKSKCIIKKGYFPQTAKNLEEKFCFVSIDVDLYLPIYNSLVYFYPKLNEGGYLMIHDYNNREFTGVRKAICDYERDFKIYLKKVPISDQGGTIIIVK